MVDHGSKFHDDAFLMTVGRKIVTTGDGCSRLVRVSF